MVFHGRLLWSTRRAAIVRFDRKDYLGNKQESLDKSVRDIVEKEKEVRPLGPIRMLTNLRYFGFAMNPVSIYYCFDEDGKTLENIVAEVSNTPWNQKHIYVLDSEQIDLTDDQSTEKCFHVSPFMPMDMQYHWNVPRPDQTLSVQIESHQNGSKKFDACLDLKRIEINSLNLTRSICRFPVMTLKVFLAIYWQAIKLWMKKVPYYPNPAPQNRNI